MPSSPSPGVSPGRDVEHGGPAQSRQCVRALVNCPKPRTRRHLAAGGSVIGWRGQCRWGRAVSVDIDAITIAEIVERYRTLAGVYYRKGGKPTSMIPILEVAMRPLAELYGSALACEFGPRQIKAIRQTWIKAGLCRKSVNDYTACMRSIFRWAAEESLIDPAVAGSVASDRLVTVFS